MLATASSPPWSQLVIAIALVFFVFWVMPRYLLPRLKAWEDRRRGGRPPGPWAAAFCALCVAAFVVFQAWHGRAAGPSVGAMLIGAAGVALVVWARRRRG